MPDPLLGKECCDLYSFFGSKLTGIDMKCGIQSTKSIIFRDMHTLPNTQGHRIDCTKIFYYKFMHVDVIKWKHFPRYWSFVRGIYRSPVNSPHKGLWCGALILSLICAWINGWANNGEAGDLRRHRPHYDVTVMVTPSLELIKGTLMKKFIYILPVYIYIYIYIYIYR